MIWAHGSEFTLGLGFRVWGLYGGILYGGYIGDNGKENGNYYLGYRVYSCFAHILRIDRSLALMGRSRHSRRTVMLLVITCN